MLSQVGLCQVTFIPLEPFLGEISPVTRLEHPILVGMGTARTEDAEGTPTQSHISPSILVYEDMFSQTHMCIGGSSILERLGRNLSARLRPSHSPPPPSLFGSGISLSHTHTHTSPIVILGTASSIPARSCIQSLGFGVWGLGVRV